MENNKTEESWEERFDSVAFDWFYPNSNKEKELVRVIAQKYVDKFKSFIPQIRQEAVQSKLKELEREAEKMRRINYVEYPDKIDSFVFNRVLDAVLAIIRDKKK